MKQFERNLNIILSNLLSHENDPGFGFRMYKIKDEDQMRIFRMPRSQVRDEAAKMPTKGVFVAGYTDPNLKQTCLAFCYFPKGGGESKVETVLAYDDREINKSHKHIADWLNGGVVPVADGEFTNATEGEGHE